MVENINTLANLTSMATPPVQPPSLVAALQAFITGSGIPNVPQAILQSPGGQIITAVVLAANPKGQVLLQTPQGQVVFNSALPLTVGQQLTLETLPAQALPQRVPGAPPPPPSALPLDVRLVRVNGVLAENVFPQAASSATNTAERAQQTQPQPGQQPIQPAIGGLYLRAVFPQTPKPIQQNNTTPSSVFDAEAVEYDPSPLQNRATFKATVLNTPALPMPVAPAPQNAEFDPIAATLGQVAPEQTQPEESVSQIKTGDVLTLKITGGTLVAQPSPETQETAEVPLLTTAFTQTKAPAVPAPNNLPMAGNNPQIATTPATPAATMPSAAPVEEVNVLQQFLASTSTLPQPDPQETAQTQPPLSPAASSLFASPAEEGPFVTTPTLPMQPKPSAAAPATANTLSGVVIAQEPDGSAIVQTSVATLRLPADVPLPKGTQLTLQVSDIEHAQDIYAASQLPRSFQTGNPATDALVKGSTALDMLFKQITGMSTHMAKDVAEEMIPQPGRQFGNKILQFIAGIKQDTLPENIRQVLPKEMVEQLNLNRTTPEFSSLKVAMAEAPPPQWSFMLVPVMQGDEMQHMRWFKRKQEREAQDKDGGDGTRFVVELETHSLGSIQLDGLFFNQPKEKEFDLVIRSQKPFSDDEQQQIAGIYNNYGEITGYRGSLRFEQTQAFPVHPLADIISGDSREISA
jgi:hypothetical protein